MILSRLAALWRRFARSTKGTACVELAVATPVFITLMLGGVDLTRYVLAAQKTERVAATIADLVSQSERLKESDLADLFNVTTFVMEPFDTSGTVQVLVSAINNPSGTAKVAWQRSWGGLANGSTFGTEGSNAVLPTGMIVRQGETTLGAEVFFNFEALFLPDLFPDATLYRRAIFRPRFSNLDTIEVYIE
jgi:Flp pilus assembly protein TadG